MKMFHSYVQIYFIKSIVQVGSQANLLRMLPVSSNLQPVIQFSKHKTKEEILCSSPCPRRNSACKLLQLLMQNKCHVVLVLESILWKLSWFPHSSAFDFMAVMSGRLDLSHSWQVFFLIATSLIVVPSSCEVNANCHHHRMVHRVPNRNRLKVAMVDTLEIH